LRFVGKDCGLCQFNPSAEEVGGLEVFFYETAHNFELFSNIEGLKLKKTKTYRG
jgi:hypothetical protein